MKAETDQITFELPPDIQAGLDRGEITPDTAFTKGITDIMIRPSKYDFHPDAFNIYLVPYFIKMMNTASNHGVSLTQILPDIIKNVIQHCDATDKRDAEQGKSSNYHPEGGSAGLAGSVGPINIGPLENTSLLYHFIQGKLNRKTYKNPAKFEKEILAPGQEKWFKTRHDAYQNLIREV